MKGDSMKKLSDEALKGMTDGELKTTVRRLETRAGKMRRRSAACAAQPLPSRDGFDYSKV